MRDEVNRREARVRMRASVRDVSRQIIGTIRASPSGGIPDTGNLFGNATLGVPLAPKRKTVTNVPVVPGRTPVRCETVPKGDLGKDARIRHHRENPKHEIRNKYQISNPKVPN